jgi:hypothetical protein
MGSDLLHVLLFGPRADLKNNNQLFKEYVVERILSYIELKRQETEKGRFFLLLLGDHSIPGEKRLSWAPLIVPFIMGYSDLNKYIFRNEENQGDRIQKDLNIHTFEEDFHWQWMLDDFDVLGINANVSMADAARIYWSPGFTESRLLVMKIARLAAMYPESYQIFAMVEAIESISITIFRYCCGIKNRYGQECQFFGNKHYEAEAGHSIKEEGVESLQIKLDDRQRRIAYEIIDEAFTMFRKWCDSLADFSLQLHKMGKSFCYEPFLQESRDLPREALLPEYS